MQDRLAAQRAQLAALRARFGAPRARFDALVAGTRSRFGNTALTAFQWIICALLAVIVIAACLSLIGLRSGATELSDGIRENTRVLSTLHADVLKGFAGLEQKITDMNQKLSDIAVEIDDTLLAQKAPNRASEPKGGARKASSRAGRGSRDLTVRRGRER